MDNSYRSLDLTVYGRQEAPKARREQWDLRDARNDLQHDPLSSPQNRAASSMA
jgi:hypothetical protein